MEPADSTLRVQGIAIPDVSDWTHPRPEGKWSSFYKALAERVGIVGITRPRLSRIQEAGLLVASFHPHRHRWRARYGFNLRRVAALDRTLAAELHPVRESFDLIVQLQTLCSPQSVGAPYVIYTDNTFALTRRLFPEAAALTPATSERWQRFEASVCHSAALVCTFSEFARASMIDDYGCDPSGVVAIGAGANQYDTSVADHDYTTCRALFVGSPLQAKGGETLLRAWPAVRRALPEAELIIAGPTSDPGGGDGVRWVGRVARAELTDLYRSATVFVLPSLFDAWGHVFVEAMGYGLPCIGSDICAMPEIITAGRTGSLVRPGDAVGLADAMIAILSDPARAAAMGRAGHERAIPELTWERVADRLIGALRDRGLLAH